MGSGEWDLLGFTCCVYRVYDHRGILLYVGIADNLGRRIGQHLGQSEWGGRARRVEWDEYDCRETAEEVEAEQIQALKPLYNKVSNTYWDATAIPLGPVPVAALPPAVRARHAQGAARRIALGDRL